MNKQRMTFASNLNYLMATASGKRPTLAKIADLTSSHTQTVYRWKAGQADPTAEQLDALADFFDVSVADLLNKQLDNQAAEQTTLLAEMKEIKKLLKQCLKQKR